MNAYVDTSCLAAIAFGEPGAATLARRLKKYDRRLSSNLLEAELRSALAKEKIDVACDDLLSWIGWVSPDRPLTPEIREVQAAGYARGADVWHLACALFLRRRLSDLAFVTLDDRQRDLAKRIGLAT